MSTPTNISDICDALINFEPENVKSEPSEKEITPPTKKSKISEEVEMIEIVNQEEGKYNVPRRPSKESNDNISLDDAKFIGSNTLEEFLRQSDSNIVFISIGVGVWGDMKKEFISHLGAISPDSDKFFSAIVTSGLLKQMELNRLNSQFIDVIQSLGYSSKKDSVYYRDRHECVLPQVGVNALSEYLQNLKKKRSKLVIIMESGKQIEVLGDLLKKENALDLEILSKVKIIDFPYFTDGSETFQNYDFKTLITLQAAPENKEKLFSLLQARSDLMAKAMFEAFCILLVKEQNVHNSLIRLLAVENACEIDSDDDKKSNSNDSVLLEESINRTSDLNDTVDSTLSEITPTSKTEGDDKREEVADHFNSENTVTLFINPIFFSRDRITWTSKSKVPTHLIGIDCFFHPLGESFFMAITPNKAFLRTADFLKVHSYIEDGRTLKYVHKSGETSPCYPRTKAFDNLADILGQMRKREPCKQFNLFVKDFEVFKELMEYTEFTNILKRLEHVVTLFNQSSQILARVPDIPVALLAGYVNEILVNDSSSVLHKEHVSNLFVGRKL